MCEKDIRVNCINGPNLYTIYQFGPQPFNSVNLVPNLSIPCHFGTCHYPLDGKVWCVKWNNKKLIYLPHQLPTVQPHHINFFFF